MAEITENETDELEGTEGTEGTEGEQPTGGDPEVGGPEVKVIVEDNDGEIDELTQTIEETIEETIDGPQYCKGSFRMLTASCFTQNENYSDDYLKGKGLFDMSDEVAEDAE